MSKTRKSRSKKVKNNFTYSKYKFEFLILFLIFFGLFLLLEDFELKKFIRESFIYIISTFKHLIFYFYRSTLEFFLKIEFSDIIGLVLLFIAFFLVLIRWRNELINKYPSFEFCLVCKGKSQRIRRKLYIKIFGFFFRLKIRKYQCKDCNLKSYKLTSL